MAIETETSPTAKPARGFHEECRDIEATRRVLVHGGESRHRLRDDVEAMPLADLMTELLDAR